MKSQSSLKSSVSHEEFEDSELFLYASQFDLAAATHWQGLASSILHIINQLWEIHKISLIKVYTFLGSKTVCEYADSTNKDISFGWKWGLNIQHTKNLDYVC